MEIQEIRIEKKTEWGIETDIRYIIVDETTGEIIDDAQGYGYKTKQKAYSAYNYKFNGGKKKHSEYKEFWKKRKEIAKFIDELYSTWLKEIARGEIVEEDILEEVEKQFGEKIPKKMLKYTHYAFNKK